MRARLVGVVMFGLAVSLAAPSSAEPDRTVMLSRDAPTASWNGALSVGTVYFGGDASDPFECIEPTQGCDDTLIQLTKPGTLTVTAKSTGPLPAFFITQSLTLYRSDAAGVPGERIGTNSVRHGVHSVTATRLAAGRYLARVFYREGANSYAGRATFVPAGR